jgi:hypothetical protein
LLEQVVSSDAYIEGYEAMHAIRKGQIRWLPKGDAVGRCRFIHALFGIAA